MVEEIPEKEYDIQPQHIEQKQFIQKLTITPNQTPRYFSTDTFEFEFEVGRESIHRHMIPTTQQFFMGYCYYCDYPQHSQNFCPLRYCYFCEAYGHSSRVCSKKQYFSNYSSNNNFSRHWKKPKRLLKIPFGSTWKDDVHGVLKKESWRKKENLATQVLFDFDNK
jgi:hypothetical protein